MASGADVLVSNSYPDEHQFNRAVWLAPRVLKEGGDLVIVGWTHDGQAIHQYAGRFGTDFGGRGYSPAMRAKPLANAGRVIILAPFLAHVDRMEWGAEKVVWCKNWGEVLAELAGRHGPGTKVAVYPYTALQIGN